MKDKSAARLLAEMALSTGESAIPEKSYDAAKKIILDTLGVSIAGHKAPGISGVLAQMREWGGKPEAELLVFGGRLPAPNAAFVNSAMAHALDFDSVHKPSSLHLMVLLLPAALAAAQAAESSGKEFLAGIILGQEVACRIGTCFQEAEPEGGYPGQGFLPSSVVGGIGGVAAVCRLMEMTVEQTVNAMGINYAQASGNRQALFDKTLVKRIQPALAARSALWSAALARRGMTGSANIIEGKAGLFSIYRNVEPPPPAKLTEPRDFFEIERDSVKRYPVCGQAIADAGVCLGKKHTFKPRDMEFVEIYMGGVTEGLTTAEFEIGDFPQVNAQFTSRYAVALGLLRGRIGLREISDEQIIKDREAARLAREIVLCSRMENIPPGRSADKGVRVKTVDGRTHTCFRSDSESFGPGSMSMDDVVNKFYSCAEFSGICSMERASLIVDAVGELDSAADIQELLDSMAFGSPAD